MCLDLQLERSIKTNARDPWLTLVPFDILRSWMASWHASLSATYSASMDDICRLSVHGWSTTLWLDVNLRV